MPDETVEQWVIRTRRAQGLPDHIEDEAVLADLAQAVLEASEEEKKPDDRDPPSVLPASRREHVGVVDGEHAGWVRSPAGRCLAGLDGQVVGVMLTRS